jgi:hypothetical protein
MSPIVVLAFVASPRYLNLIISSVTLERLGRPVASCGHRARLRRLRITLTATTRHPDMFWRFRCKPCRGASLC